MVGLARVNSLPDLAVDLASATVNPVMGLIRHPRPARPEGAAVKPAGHARQGARRYRGRDLPRRPQPACRALPSMPALVLPATPCAGTSRR